SQSLDTKHPSCNTWSSAMKSRGIIFITLGILIVSGLIAGLFMAEIQKALTITNVMGKTTMNATGPTANNPAAMQAMPNMKTTATPATAGTMPAQTQNGTTLASDNFQRQDQHLW